MHHSEKVKRSRGQERSRGQQEPAVSTQTTFYKVQIITLKFRWNVLTHTAIVSINLISCCQNRNPSMDSKNYHHKSIENVEIADVR